MIKIYFVCMGNYYRSRLAEELAIYYARQSGLEIAVDSGGLSDVVHSLNPGPIAKAVLRYLEDKGITPVGAQRYPKPCFFDDINSADIVVCTDAEEQLHLFKQRFPNYAGKIISWHARDQYDDPLLQTPFLIDKHIHGLIKELNDDT